MVEASASAAVLLTLGYTVIDRLKAQSLVRRRQPEYCHSGSARYRVSLVVTTHKLGAS